MNIVLVDTYHFRGGGGATYTFSLAGLLQQHGHAVSFFAMRDPRNIPDPNDDLFVSHIDFREMNRRKSLINGMRVVTRAIYSREARDNFAHLLDRVHPDLIHIQSLHGHLTPSIIFEAKKRVIPVLWTAHDYKLICPNTSFLIDRNGQVCEACGTHAYYQPLLKRCKKDSLLASGLASLEAYVHLWLGVRDQVNAFVTPSSFLRDKLLSRGFDSARVHHIPNFLSNGEFLGSVSSSDGYLLFMGRVEAIKGLTALVAAARLAPNIRILIAGSADESAQRTWLSQLPGNVEYIGFLQGEQKQRYLAGALAVVAPSICYENQPYSILEAFAMRKPVIATHLGGLRELVADQERGLLVPPSDPQALAGAMQWLVDHPLEAQVMGERAYDYVRVEHNEDNHYAKLLVLYAQCLSGRGAKGLDVQPVGG